MVTRVYRIAPGLLDPAPLPGDPTERAALLVGRQIGHAGLGVGPPQGRLDRPGRSGSAQLGGDLLVRREVLEGAALEPRAAQTADDLDLQR